ncbi:MAG: hypothetical protein HUK04_02435 [Bacteroidaceae bacterium]|nr:hypothetical protein [Bacteroidaceae bacterium]
MSIFWKRHTEPVPVASLPEQTAPASADQASHATVSKTDINKEATRRQARLSKLSAEELSAVQEQRRLAMLQLDSVQKQIDEVTERIRMHNVYVDRKAHHDAAEADMYARHKLLASMRDEEQKLMRFEMCEEALPLYISLQMKDEWHQQSRAAAATLKEKLREAQALADRQRANTETARNALADANAMLKAREEALAVGYRTDGQRMTIAEGMKSLEMLGSVVMEAKGRYMAQKKELEQRARACEERMTTDKNRFAPLDSSRSTMEQIDSILVYLDNMHSINDKRENLRKQSALLTSRQNDMNSRLSDLFRREQELVQQLSSLHAEVDMHRAMNHGQNGQSLQMTVVNLRSRKQELYAAESKWNLICELHEQAENKRQDIRKLQQTIDRVAGEIVALEVNVNALEAEATQRRYDYTLSKGQNVIKLRGDLREGVACTVCGATTHPFHSDTMLEQNKLISEWKSEADRLDMELKQARGHLLAKQIENATNQGMLATKVEDVEWLTNKLKEFARQWETIENLDPSLKGFQPNAMAVARMQTIRGLIENCTRDENASMEELKTFNYHQQAINTAQEKIDEIENERQDIHTGLTESNTGCQVLANQMETIRDTIRQLDSEYQMIYEQLDKVIYVSDWHQKLQQSHDNLKAQLRGQYTEWNQLRISIRENEAERASVSDGIALTETLLADFDIILQKLERWKQGLAEQDRDASNLYNRLFGDLTATQTYQRAKDNASAKSDNWIKAMEELVDTVERCANTCGKYENASQEDARLSNAVGSARTALDDWMYKFRIAGNPPCRIDELEELFDASNDWNRTRERIRSARQDYNLSKLHEEDVRSSMLSLEHGEMSANSATQRETLLRQRREILLSIARFEQRLAAHEQALKQLEILE